MSADWSMSHRAYDAPAEPAFRSGCDGTFRVSEDDGKSPAWVECDGCGTVITVPQVLLTARVAEPTASMEW